MDERFTIMDVCDLLGISVTSGRHSITIKCPNCGKEHEKKLNINFEKNAFRCAKCGVSGYAVHLWALFRGLSFGDLTAVTRDYYAARDGQKTELKFSSNSKELYKPIDVPAASIDIRNRTYEALLSILSLTEEHEKNLIKRGLPVEVISKNEYRSYPLAGHSSIASVLLQNGCILEGCPGFYKGSDGLWTLRRLPSGIIIPQRDGFNRIQGFQIRLDNEVSGSKYLTLSTGENFYCGSKGYAYPHFSAGKRGLSEIIITEGPLKGDIISHFTGFSVLALQGVNSVSRLDDILLELSSLGTELVLIAFDMDLKTNPMVKEALERLRTKISNAGLSFQQICWDEKYKGLDDWLLANFKAKKA